MKNSSPIGVLFFEPTTIAGPPSVAASNPYNPLRWKKLCAKDWSTVDFLSNQTIDQEIDETIRVGNFGRARDASTGLSRVWMPIRIHTWLGSLLNSENSDQLVAELGTLAHCFPDADKLKLVEGILPLIEHPHPGTRASPVETLGKSGIRSSEVLNTLEAASLDDDSDVSLSAKLALARLNASTEEAIAVFDTCISEVTWVREQEALDCLLELGRNSHDAIDALIRASKIGELDSSLCTASAGRLAASRDAFAYLVAQLVDADHIAPHELGALLRVLDDRRQKLAMPAVVAAVRRMNTTEDYWMGYSLS